MIPDEEEDDGIIDFSWFWFIGTKKLGLTFRETGRLTLTMFNRLYKQYKDDWDWEMQLFHARMTYEQSFRQAQKEQEWF